VFLTSVFKSQRAETDFRQLFHGEKIPDIFHWRETTRGEEFRQKRQNRKKKNDTGIHCENPK